MSQYSGTGTTTDTKQGIRQDVEHLRDDVSRLRQDAASTARDLASAAKTGLREAGSYACDTVDAARARGEEAAEQLRQSVRQHPLTTVASAFGVGVLLGAMLRRL